jgi:hypothetical protein
MKYLKILLLSGLMGFMTQQTFAQKEQLDKIVAIVGDKVILKSMPLWRIIVVIIPI